MLEYNEIRERKYIIFEKEPYEVLTSHTFRKQQRKAVNQVKLRNLITGNVRETTFQQGNKANEAEIEIKKIKYLFHKLDRQTEVEEYWFADPKDPSQRFFLSEKLIGKGSGFMKQNEEVEALSFEDKIFGVRLPIKVSLKVTESAPAVAGNTAQGATKQVTLETGAMVAVPLFIKEGDVLSINTETGQYVSRV